MSGHSKWSTIKRQKGKTDAQRGKIFTKIGREIAVAVKEGGPDPETNNKLKYAIAKAKQNNMPNDNVTRTIKKASGEVGSVDYEEITYEGYGTSGSAVMLFCLTDNRNRTASDVRHAFDKFGGSLGQTGSVSYLFSKKGVIVLEKEGLSYDELFEIVLENDGEDLEDLEESFVITTTPDNYSKVLSAVEAKQVKIVNSDIEYVAQSTITLDENKQNTFNKMIAHLEDLDDVSQIYHNVEL